MLSRHLVLFYLALNKESRESLIFFSTQNQISMTAMLRAVTLAAPFGPASCSLPEEEKESSHTAKPATGY